MCGIAGVFHFDGEPVSSVILKKMTDAIAHRGPDGEGQFIEGGVGLGHRRLAIIDRLPGCEAGAQRAIRVGPQKTANLLEPVAKHLATRAATPQRNA